MAPPSEDQRAVLAAAKRRAAALVARDPEALRSLHHPALRWTTHRADVLDREAYVRGNTEGELRWLGQTLEAAEVVIVGDAAVLCGLVVDDVEVGGETVSNRLRITQVWVRSGDGWLCLAGHAGPRIT